jgi:hypothetical protein
MSVRKLTASLLTVLALLGGVASVQAQHPRQHLADPFEFDPDFRWFEPVWDMDLADLKPKKRAHTGWFATYDRLNLYGSRPEIDEPRISEEKIDNGWGHRYEIGYMTRDDHGWLFNATYGDVGKFVTVRQERINRYIEPDDDPPYRAPPFGIPVRQREGNNFGFNFRFYDIQDTENVFSYDFYELNKTWRLEPYHYGGILEPMVGVRWMRLNDTNAFQQYNSTTAPPPLILPPPLDGLDAEQLTTTMARTENEMFGGQVGFRYFKSRDRFTASSDFRCFFGGNWACSKSQIFNELTTYDGDGQGDAVTRILTSATEPIYSRNEEFYVGFDVRGELDYQLTKLVSVRGGFQVIHIGRGVWRGGDGSIINGGDMDQDVLLVGGTFGINLNH